MAYAKQSPNIQIQTTLYYIICLLHCYILIYCIQFIDFCEKEKNGSYFIISTEKNTHAYFH